MKSNLLLLSLFSFAIFSCKSNEQFSNTQNENNSSVEIVSQKDEEQFKNLTEKRFSEIDISDFSDGFNHARYYYENSLPPWNLYEKDQILGFAENMVYLQNPDGGWAKNLDLQRVFTLQELKDLQEKNKSVPVVTYYLKTSSKGSTIDNGNIFSQIKYLCQVYSQVKNIEEIDSERYLDCALRALQWIFNAQHPESGGFTGADVYAVTYNDNVMSDTLEVLRDISEADEKSVYFVIPENMRKEAEKRYKTGIECILKTQITVTLPSGEKLLTAWCQQHSHETLQPIWAREFEPPSISSAESFNVLRFLMSIESPSEEIKKAVLAGGNFFARDDVIIHDRKLQKFPLEKPVTLGDRTYTTDQKLVDSPGSVLWARFYALDSSFDITTGARKPIQGTYPEVLKPVWCSRKCIFVNDYNDISQERRNGYGYVNTSGIRFLKEFNQWKNNNNL